MNIDLASIGLSAEDIQERVIDRIVESFLLTTLSDEDGEPVIVVSQYKQEVNKRILAAVDAAVARLFAPTFDQSVETILANFRVEHTNTYGEKKRDPETITEYILRRSDSYLRERVDYHGKSAEDYKREGNNSGSNSYNKIRINHLIDARLQSQIDTAMKDALKDANALVVGGLQAAVVDSLKQLNAKLAK